MNNKTEKLHIMYDGMSVTAIVVAAGASRRMGFDKLFSKIGGREVVWLAANAMAQHAYVDDVVLVASQQNMEKMQALFAERPLGKPVQYALGGATRTESVAAGVAFAGGDIVAIHDAARPFVSSEIIAAAIEAAAEIGGAAPAVAVKDTIKEEENGFIAATPPRHKLMAVQTPQTFRRVEFAAALAAVPQSEYEALTDDCMVMERAGKAVRLVEGSFANRKITTPEDLEQEKGGTGMQLRVGHGYDVHKFEKGRRLVLGGVEVPYALGLAGHSDADVLLHAVADAVLGGAAQGDIGVHFPPSDGAYKDADSLKLLATVAQVVRKAGWVAQNVDATLVCQAPKLAAYIGGMRENIAGALGLPLAAVSVKATTEEGLGFTGRGEGIAAHCVVLLCSENV